MSPTGRTKMPILPMKQPTSLKEIYMRAIETRKWSRLFLKYQQENKWWMQHMKENFL